MKRTATILIFLSLCLCALAQTDADYLLRYNALVKRVGHDGVGVETLLDNWQRTDSLSINMMLGRFNYYFALSARDTLIIMEQQRYLGQKPIMSLKDSLGVPHNYFRETIYDDAIFGKAVKWLDNALAVDIQRLDVVEAKAAAFINYEKESPDLALECVKGMITDNFKNKYQWKYSNQAVDEEFFEGIVQSLCYTFYQYGTKNSYNAFRDVSNLMLKFSPKNVTFLDNMGSYYLVAADNPSKAKKYYQAALKVKPDDTIAAKNLKIVEKKLSKKGK